MMDPRGYICRGGVAVAPEADHPTRTLTRARTLRGDLCLDAVACEVDVVACEGFYVTLFSLYVRRWGVYGLYPHPGGD